MSLTSIPRVSGISRDAFHRDYVAPGIPVILEDAVRDWPAVAKWNLDYLTKACGDQRVMLRQLDVTKPIGQENIEVEKSMAEYLASIPHAEPARPYLSERPLGATLPSLVADVGVNHYGNSTPENLFIMLGAKTFAPLHFHGSQEAVSAQIAGKRRFLLMPPNEIEKLNPYPVISSLRNFARRDLRGDSCNDLEAFEAILSPGEALYIPVHWWHTVFSSDELSILVVDFFASPTSIPKGWRPSKIAARLAAAKTDFEVLRWLMREASDDKFRTQKAAEFEMMYGAATIAANAK